MNCRIYDVHLENQYERMIKQGIQREIAGYQKRIDHSEHDQEIRMLQDWIDDLARHV